MRSQRSTSYADTYICLRTGSVVRSMRTHTYEGLRGNMRMTSYLPVSTIKDAR